MENYVKIIEEAVKSLTRIPKFADAVKGHDITLNGIIVAMQTILKDTELTKAFCKCMNASIADDYYFSHYDMKGNIRIVITDSSLKNVIEKWKKEARERITLNDTSTDDIVSHLLAKGKSKISYSDIYDEVINVCIANYRAITEFNYEDILQNFPTTDTMNKIYREVMQDPTLDFYRDLKDEFMLNFRYIEDSNTISLSGRLSGGGNSNADASTQKSRMIKYLHKGINKLPLPNKDFFQRLSSAKKYNPYSLDAKNVKLSEYNSFISLLIPTTKCPLDQQKSSTLLFKKKNRKTGVHFKPFELYYCEEIFKPSYIKCFATDLYKKISKYVNERWTEKDLKNLSELQSTIKSLTISQSAFQKKYLPLLGDNSSDGINRMIDDTICNIDHLLRLFETFYEGYSLKGSLKRIGEIMGSYSYGRNGKQHNPGCFENILSQLKLIKNLLNEEPLIQKQEALITSAYLVADQKIYLGEQSIFINDKKIISAYNFSQTFGEKEIFSQIERISASFQLNSLLTTTPKILDNKIDCKDKKIKSQLLNAQKILVNIIYDSLIYCCNMINYNIVLPLTDPDSFAKILIYEDNIKSIYDSLYCQYSDITGNGRSLICRVFCDTSMPEYDKYLRRFQILNSYVIEYIFRKINEVSSALIEHKQNTGKLKIECDNTYVYSYNLYNQFDKIQNNLFNPKGEMNYKIIASEFDFNSGFDSRISKHVNKVLMDIYQEYILKFISELFEKNY